MSHRQIVEQTMTLVYLQLINWVKRYVSDPQAETIAAVALANIVGDGMRGRRTQYGPFRALYQCAEFHMRWWGQANGCDIPFGIWRTIPAIMPAVSCEFARCYAAFYQGTELAEVSNPEQDLILSVLEQCRYDEHGNWVTPLGNPDVSVAVTIISRVARVLDEHDCKPYDGCGEFSDLWTHEDRISARWLAEFRHHARDNVYVW